MNSLSEYTELQLSCEARVEDYLDHLCAPLVGIVAYEERNGLRYEAREHIEGLIREYLYAGIAKPEAIEIALKEFGEPWKLGEAFLKEWSLEVSHRRSPRLNLMALSIAFAWFGMATMLMQLLLERYIFVTYQYIFDPCMIGFAFAAPILVGAIVGATVSSQGVQATRNVILALSLHSTVAGLFMLPQFEGLFFAMWQLLFWLPAGCLAAWGSARCVRHFRRQRFWQLAR